MIRTIGYYFQDQFNKLPWADLTAGIVSTQTKDVNGVIKKFPVYPFKPQTCNNSTYYDLVPNDQKRSILYCEDGGVRAIYKEETRVPSLTNFVASVKVVCWYNGLSFQNEEDRLFVKLPFDLMAMISRMDLKHMTPDGMNNFTGVSLRFISQEPKSPTIFGKYTYNETERQYLMFPFDYFALNYEVYFSFDPLCIVNPFEKTEICG